MDARQLRYFVAIYEHGALARAAQDVRVAVSALSHHLTNLETELGTPLFVRKPRGMEPTAAGERLYSHGRSILKALASAERDVRAASGEIAGTVSVGMAYSAVKAIGVEMIRRVTDEHPKLRLSLSESLSGSTLLHLLSSEIELAVVYNPPDDPRLRTRAVLEERMMCIGRPEIIGRSNRPITFAHLLKLPIIILRQGLSARAIMDNAALLKKLEAAAQFQMNSVYAISGSLLAGLGCAIGTRHFLSEHIKPGLLNARPIIEPELKRTLYVCQMADRPASFALETVEKLIRELIEDAVRAGRWEATSLSGSRQRDGGSEAT